MNNSVVLYSNSVCPNYVNNWFNASFDSNSLKKSELYETEKSKSDLINEEIVGLNSDFLTSSLFLLASYRTDYTCRASSINDRLKLTGLLFAEKVVQGICDHKSAIQNTQLADQISKVSSDLFTLAVEHTLRCHAFRFDQVSCLSSGAALLLQKIFLDYL